MSTPPLTPLATAVLRVSPPPERVLEVECGEGDGALFLAREFPAARVRGVDRSGERIRAATARVGLDPEGRIAFKAGRPTSLPYPDDFFDLVVQGAGRAVPAELARVLRPGGALILHDAGASGWLLRQRFARHGIEPLESTEAAGGSFSFGRLRGGDRAPAGD